MSIAPPLRRSNRSRLALGACGALLGLTLAGCGTMQRAGTAPPSSAAPAADATWRGRERVRDAIAHLNRGEPRPARRLLIAALRRQPGDTVARQLLAQIDTDPRQLLGQENFSYTLRPGDTLSSVAQRAFGDPMMFYALARYNNIAVPTSVVPGQAILVPGRRPAPPPPPPPPPPPRQEPRAAPPRATPAPPPAPEAVAPAPRPVQRGNPAQAARLRGQGLAALNAGAINRAVALLRQALALDPGNAVIRNDLNRALRIQNTVRSRP